MNRNRRDKSRSAGQAMVELALALPVLVALLFGIFEVGRLLQSYVTIQHAVYEAARYAATGDGYDGGTREANVINAATEACTGLSLDPAAGETEPGYLRVVSRSSSSSADPNAPNDSGGPNEFVRVQLIYNHPLLLPSLFGGEIHLTLTSESMVLNERFGRSLYNSGQLPPTPLPFWTPTEGPSTTPLPTNTATNTPTPTPTATNTPTPIPTATNTPTPVPPTPTNTPTPSPTATNTPTPSPTATNTPTPSPTATNTPTPSPTATNTPTPTPTATNTSTPTPTATNTPVPPTATRTNTPTLTPTRTNTPTLTPTRTNTPTLTPTLTPTPTATPTRPWWCTRWPWLCP